MSNFVYVLYGRGHIEIFEDSERGIKLAENRRRHLESLNNYTWNLKLERFRVK